MTLSAGDTFRDASGGTDVHLWIVLSDPARGPDRVLIANLTTWRDGCDDACILNPGDHPFVVWKTYVRYRAARVVSAATITTGLASGALKSGEPVSAPLLSRLRLGARNSRFIELGCQELLRNQGLI